MLPIDMIGETAEETFQEKSERINKEMDEKHALGHKQQAHSSWINLPDTIRICRWLEDELLKADSKLHSLAEQDAVDGKIRLLLLKKKVITDLLAQIQTTPTLK